MHIICKIECLPLDATFPFSPQAGLVVAEVFSVNAHPKSDRLRVCSVDYGHDVAQVVTNAAEVAAGMKVIFAVCTSTCISCRRAPLDHQLAFCILSCLAVSKGKPVLACKRHACILYFSKACRTLAKHVIACTLLVHVKRKLVSILGVTAFLAPALLFTSCSLVPLQGIGITVPGSGITISKTAVRGVDSFGMLCSAHDIGWSDKADGVLVVMPDETQPGDACPADPPKITTTSLVTDAPACMHLTDKRAINIHLHAQLASKVRYS